MNAKFDNFVFVDETTLRVGEIPLYQIRQKGSPQAQCVSSKQRLKINLWGGISNQGLTTFKVS